MQSLIQLFHRHLYNTQTARKMVSSSGLLTVIYFYFQFSVAMIVTIVDSLLIVTLR